MSCQPFDQLVSVATRRQWRPAGPAVPHDGDTKTDSLLRLLADWGPMSTSELSSITSLSSRQVWGLLKSRRECGQIRHSDGLWELDRGFPGADVLRAAELLRNCGWMVEPPSNARAKPTTEAHDE